MVVKAQLMMEHAPPTIMHYCSEMKGYLDNTFGADFCKKNPAILAQYVAACVADFHAVALYSFVEAVEGIDGALHALAQAVESAGSGIGEAASSVGTIAGAHEDFANSVETIAGTLDDTRVIMQEISKAQADAARAAMLARAIG